MTFFFSEMVASQSQGDDEADWTQKKLLHSFPCILSTIQKLILINAFIKIIDQCILQNQIYQGLSCPYIIYPHSLDLFSILIWVWMKKLFWFPYDSNYFMCQLVLMCGWVKKLLSFTIAITSVFFFPTLLVHLLLIFPQSSHCDQLIGRREGERKKENECCRMKIVSCGNIFYEKKRKLVGLRGR